MDTTFARGKTDGRDETPVAVGRNVGRPSESVALRLDPPPRPVAHEPGSIPPPPRHSLLMRVNRRRGQILTVMVSIAAIASCDAPATKKRAAAEDPGRTAVTVLVILASLAGLVAVTVLVRRPGITAPRQEAELIALCLATVVVSWTLTHSAFTLRYAHLYYREDAEGVGGAEFPGRAPPSYLDFAYLAFTVGMTFQTSDAVITCTRIRQVVIGHGVAGFVFNIGVLAFTINLLASGS